MLENVQQHAAGNPALLVIFILSLIVIAFLVPYFLKQQRLYGRMFDFASKGSKGTAGIAVLVLVGLGIYLVTPYTEPPSDEIAIVLGNTQNTPAPSIDGDVSDAIVATMLEGRGEGSVPVAESIRFISATKQPSVISLNKNDIKLRNMSANTTNAKRDARLNIEALSEKLNGLGPVSNGANYFEAIITASRNVKEGSKIIVIGSGLSDAGDLNFSKTGILTNEDVRTKTIADLSAKYQPDDLRGYTVEFYGLGDTTTPQEPLSSIQKDIVRDVYKDAVRALGGKVTMNTRTQTGNPVATTFAVGTTDTGCGDINLIFDDEDLKFVGDMATFIDRAAATKTLAAVHDIWTNQRDTIEAIQIDGYTAHYPGAGALSQNRADAVKNALIGLGIPANTLTATGKGYGPYETDAQNRSVKVNISRDNAQCMQ